MSFVDIYQANSTNNSSVIPNCDTIVNVGYIITKWMRNYDQYSLFLSNNSDPSPHTQCSRAHWPSSRWQMFYRRNHGPPFISQDGMEWVPSKGVLLMAHRPRPSPRCSLIPTQCEMTYVCPWIDRDCSKIIHLHISTALEGLGTETEAPLLGFEPWLLP